MKEFYSSRKYRELITMKCAERCLRSFRDDDLTRAENKCLTMCYHKSYRYMSYTNTLYSYLTANQELDRDIKESTMEEPDDDESN